MEQKARETATMASQGRAKTRCSRNYGEEGQGQGTVQPSPIFFYSTDPLQIFVTPKGSAVVQISKIVKMYYQV